MLDSTVTNLAIPNLQKDFPDASVTNLSWVITGYAVMFAAWLAPAGRLSDALGRRRMFVAGVGLFTVASLLCAFAPNLQVLIGTRVLQGVGAAAMFPSSLAILLLDGPADRRAASIGTWSATSALAAAIGPAIGGVLVDVFDWRAVFLINLPFGILLMVAAMRLLHTPERVERSRIPDPLSIVLLAVGVGALILGITEGASWGWLSGGTLGCIAVGLGAIVFVMLRSSKHPLPALETSLWSNRIFAGTNVVSLLYGMAQYPFMLVGVLYVTEIWRYSELPAGLANTPGAVAASVVALGLSRMAVRVGGPRPATLFGLVTFGIAGVWLALGLTDDPAFLTLWLPTAILTGIGMGATTMGTSSAAAMSAPPDRFATSSGLNTTARQFGGALGIAAMAVILQHSTRADGSRGVDAYSGVYVYCTIMIVLALLVAAVWLRFNRPAGAS